MSGYIISDLAVFFRESGDELLEGKRKLVLHDFLLKELNEAFAFALVDEDEDSSFQVIKTNNAKVDFLNDIQFLHDFVQKVISLSVTKGSTNSIPHDCKLDVSKFRCLKILELKNIPIGTVRGIQNVRGKLHTIICTRCLQTLQDLLRECGADKSSGFLWEELKEAVITYNTLGAVDSSFVYTPWLETLDLSHNRLTCFEALDALPNLKHLDLSHNLLERVPCLSREASCRLEVLLIKNNYVSEVSALRRLEALLLLDLGCNSLAEHCCLAPLQYLGALASLNLEGNPLSFCPQHRSLTLQWLAPGRSHKFVLDHSALSCSERAAQRRAASRPPPVQSPTHSTSSRPASVSALRAAPVAARMRQGRRVKEAKITESCEGGSGPERPPTPELEASGEHLETKRQIEQLRARFGEEHWLSQHGGSCLQEVLGLPGPSSGPSGLSLSSSPRTTPTPVAAPAPAPAPAPIPAPAVAPAATCRTEQQTEEQDVQTEQETGTELEEAKLQRHNSDGDAEDQLLLAAECTAPGTAPQHVLLGLGAHRLREFEVKGGSAQHVWDLRSLQSCTLLATTPFAHILQLTFNTRRPTLGLRQYSMEPADAQHLLQLLSAELEARSLAAMHQLAYACMRCSMQFCHEETMQPGQARCPGCGCTVVCALEEEPLPAARPLPPEPRPPSRGSTGSAAHAAGTRQEPAVEPVAAAPAADPPAPHRSAASQGSANHSPLGGTRGCDSDIEIISNPSQSSIEILDGDSRKPSAERQLGPSNSTSNTAAALPVPSAAPAGLTESSSSGSFTDSVCTSYEQQAPRSAAPSAALAPPIVERNEEMSLYEQTAPADIQQMFDGLLRSVDQSLGSATSGAEVGTTDTPRPDPSAVSYSYSEPRRADHRLQLFFAQHVLTGDSEEVLLLLRGDILLPESVEPFPGLLVLTSQQLLLYAVTGPEGDCPEQWLSLRLRCAPPASLQALPWGQGVGLAPVRVLVVLQDPQRSHAWLTAAAEDPQVKDAGWAVEQEPPEYHLPALAQLLRGSCPGSSEGDGGADADCSLRLAMVFSRCSVLAGPDVHQLELGSLLVTPHWLLVTQPDVRWLLPPPHPHPGVVLETHSAQRLSDLLEVEVCGPLVSLSFLDEAAGREEAWHLSFQTEACVAALIDAVRTPWERLFSVALQVVTRTQTTA